MDCIVQSGFCPDLKKSVSKIAIGSFHMKSTRVIPHVIDLFFDNHSISHTTEVRTNIMMNGDDDSPSHFMIQSSQRVWSAAEMPNLSESSLAVGL